MVRNKRSLDTSPPSIGSNHKYKSTKKLKGQPTTLEGLEWQPVVLPDVLEDAQGFYGLEEVEGVDVQVQGRKVKYRLMDQVAKKRGTTRLEDAPQNEESSGDGSESEWRGCSDSEAVAERRLRRGKRKKNRKGNDSALQGLDTNPFELLRQDSGGDVELPGWDSLNLSLPTLRALSRLSFTIPTSIQSLAIPEIMAGHNLIGKASTGSGKTLAFGIPILEAYLCSANGAGPKFSHQKENLPMALILAPTRELVHQLRDHLAALSTHAPDIRIVALTGGLSIQKQTRQLEQGGGADVIIATPGRLWEIVSEGRGWINKLRRGLRFLVIDEADRLLQEGHFNELGYLLDLLAREPKGEWNEGELEVAEFYQAPVDECPRRVERKQMTKKHQILVFSATFHKGLRQMLSGRGKKLWVDVHSMGQTSVEENMDVLFEKLKFGDCMPKFVDANPLIQVAERLREGLIECGPMEKDLYTYYLLLRYPCRTLVFTNSISSVKRLAPFLTELGLPTHPLHSDMMQKARLRNLERFSSNKNSILIATDIAARGLDVKGIDMVIHYHLPRTADMYIHRSGRTARADERGIGVLLCAPEEGAGLRRLVAKVHSRDPDQATRRYTLKHFYVDREIVPCLKRRVALAKKIVDSSIERRRKNDEEDWLKSAAEELGVEYDSEEFSSRSVTQRGQRGRKKREKAASATQGDAVAWKAELRVLLNEKINSGFSERYLTKGVVNIAQALVEGDTMHDSILGLEKKQAIDDI